MVNDRQCSVQYQVGRTTSSTRNEKTRYSDANGIYSRRVRPKNRFYKKKKKYYYFCLRFIFYFNLVQTCLSVREHTVRSLREKFISSRLIISELLQKALSCSQGEYWLTGIPRKSRRAPIQFAIIVTDVIVWLRWENVTSVGNRIRRTGRFSLFLTVTASFLYKYYTYLVHYADYSF